MLGAGIVLLILGVACLVLAWLLNRERGGDMTAFFFVPPLMAGIGFSVLGVVLTIVGWLRQ